MLALSRLSFVSPRLRVLLPNETTLVPCVAAKPALAHLRRCALSLGTLELSADTVPTLARRNALPTLTQRESAIGVPFCGEIDDQAAVSSDGGVETKEAAN